MRREMGDRRFKEEARLEKELCIYPRQDNAFPDVTEPQLWHERLVLSTIFTHMCNGA